MLTYIVQAKQDYNQEKGSENIMSEKEKKILETIATAVPKMSEFDKGYLPYMEHCYQMVMSMMKKGIRSVILLTKHRKN